MADRRAAQRESIKYIKYIFLNFSGFSQSVDFPFYSSRVSPLGGLEQRDLANAASLCLSVSLRCICRSGKTRNSFARLPSRWRRLPPPVSVSPLSLQIQQVLFKRGKRGLGLRGFEALSAGVQAASKRPAS